jgi:hypothetical protein
MPTALDGTFTPTADVLAQWGNEQIPVGQGGFVDSGTWNQPGDTGGGIDAAGLAKAMEGLKAGTPQQPAASNLPAGASAASGGASSGAYSGNPAGMHGLVQMLMERVAALRAASNPANARPVNLQGGSRPSGLLGL